jgi:hypothetical protein
VRKLKANRQFTAQVLNSHQSVEVGALLIALLIE